MHGPNDFFGVRIIGMTQGAALLLFAVLIFYFIVKTALRQRGLRKLNALAAAA